MRIPTACLAVLPALLLAACTPTSPEPSPAPDEPPAAPDPGTEALAANFRCGDLLVGAVFDNAAGDVTLSLNARRIRLPQAVSASGARYADAEGNEFWNKGDDATLHLDGAVHECTVTGEVSPWDEARSRGVAFRGLGTEPFWSLEVDGGPAPQMRLDLDMGERRLVVAEAAPLEDGEGHAGTADDGSRVVLRITRGDCSDGMSDQIYPAGIELQVGGRDYAGCGVFLEP